MATQRKPEAERIELKKPDNFDLDKGLANVKRLVEKNKEWVREMAAK